MGIVDDLARRVLRPQLEAQDRANDNNYELLSEQLAELELALEDVGWLQLGGEALGQFSRDGLATITNLSRLYYLKNPLVQRGVDVQTYYVWGQGMTVQIEDEVINEVIQEFRDDIKNQATLTSQQAQEIKERELQTDGNLFFVLFTNEATGQVRVRSIPFNEIADVICNPEDNQEPWYYQRTYMRQEVNLESGAVVQKEITEYYPDWKYIPKTKRSTVNEKEIHWDRPIYHVKVGGFSNWKFGVSEVYAAIDWARAYKEFLEDWASITRAYRRFAFQMTGMKSKDEIAAVKSKMHSTYATGTGSETVPPPGTGSIAMFTEGRELQPIRTSGATVSAEDGRRLLLMVCAAQGLPETFYGDVSVGTLATAKSLNRPTELQMLSRQSLWGCVFAEIFNYVLMQQIKAVGGELRGKGIVEEDVEDGKIEYVIVWDEEVESKVDIDFPPIIERDIDKLVSSIVDAATLKGSMPAGTIQPRDLTRMILVALGEEDIDETLEAMYPEDGEEIEWEEETAQAIAGEFKEGLKKILSRESYPSPHVGLPGTWGGSAPRGTSGGEGETPMPKAVTTAVITARNFGLRTGREVYIAIDKDGNEVGRVEGTKDTTDVSSLKDKDTTTSVHNHPSSSSFGGSDVAVFLDSEQEAMVVVGHDGTIYSLAKTSATPSFAPDTPVSYRYQEVMDEHRTAIDRYTGQYEPQVLAGQLDANVAWKEHTHRAMQDLAKEYHLTYRRQPR